ncbi:hypothetical protein BGZ63DRAFT_361273 [Mariannaea sp. PMI_226]|nr:hypothetical protein BGZ63DRAFT_361273 [Mariannaea sp. PMI_226]
MAGSTVVADAFESAKKDFHLKFPDDPNYDFSKFSSINDVYNATDQIQNKQATTRTLRNLAKIQPFLECLSGYSAVIDTFVQVKPEILALIWGPIRLMLLISSTYMKTFDKLLDVMARIGAELPAFQKYAELFRENTQMQQVLCLFFQDILDFHATILDFFKRKKWEILFESLWPRYAGKIKVIQDNMAKHRMLMQSEVTLASITEAHDARTRALREYERSHQFQQRQDFEMILASLTPHLYDQDLEQFRERCIVESGSWLMNHAQYQKWFDASDDSTRLLWFEGIPGAGKTYLSSIVVRQILKRQDPLAFAFLNYRKNTSTLGVLQSFAFQIVLHNRDLQSMLVSAYDKDFRKLNSSVEYVKDVLKDLLVSFSATYFILDGLDEMASSERLILVRVLLELQDESKSLKMLIASRAEHDITRLLSARVEPIRVHEANHHDIQAYVHERCLMWISELGLEPEIENELTQLIKPVAIGMFLYARLICDSLVLLGDLDAVRDEVNNLPNGLEEAYGRILARIDKDLSQREREEARAILGLIACSAVPLSKAEIQLAVFTARGGNPSQGCQRLFLNLVHRCGPVLEEVDGSIQFVHFSIKEFLFSHQSAPGGYLQDPTVHTWLASMCLRYLCSDCFDSDLSDEGLRKRIISGAYVLEGYACLHWLRHVKKGGMAMNQDLLNDLGQLMEVRRNTNFCGDAVSRTKDFDCFKNASPDIHTDLTQADVFARKRWRDFCLNNLGDWEHVDPLTLSSAQLRIRTALESLLCKTKSHQQSCQCSSLKNMYGGKIYKCGRYGCPFYRTGFKTEAQRNRHMEAHTRPYKCDQAGCPFFDLGFRTQALLNIHLRQCHNDNIEQREAMLRKPETTDELKNILEDAVKADDIETMRDLSEEVQEISRELLLVAVNENSSLPILEFLMHKVKPDGNLNLVQPIDRQIYHAAAKMGNLEVFRFFPIQEWGSLSIGQIFKFSRSLENERCADLAELIFSNLTSDYLKLESLKGLHPPRPNPTRETQTLECLHRIAEHLPKSILDHGLRDIASGCLSVPIAEFYISRGANAEGAAGCDPPLYLASGKDSKEAIQFMKFLLENGANPNIQYLRAKPISARPGPRNCLQTLGMSWDTLVAQTRGARQESLGGGRSTGSSRRPGNI